MFRSHVPNTAAWLTIAASAVFLGARPARSDDPLPRYSDHQDLLYYLDAQGGRHAVVTRGDWETRRKQILTAMQQVMGPVPDRRTQVPLDVQIGEETRAGKLIRKKLTFRSDKSDRVPAYLFLPADAATALRENGPGARRWPAVLCLHQTTAAGKDEPAGIAGNPDMRYALELAQRGYITLAPDYPSFGEHHYDFAPAHGYLSGTMKAVWDNMRAVDLLLTLPEVDPRRIGCLGHSLGGHNTLFTAAFDERIAVAVSNSGFSRFHKDDVASWTGKRYMPLIASRYHNDADQVPFDFTEIVGALAPRPFLAIAPVRDQATSAHQPGHPRRKPDGAAQSTARDRTGNRRRTGACPLMKCRRTAPRSAAE
jgi:dienelactone hydrolase